MEMWLDEVFSDSELECKTRKLYQLCRDNVKVFADKFEDIFGISYDIAFGKEDPNNCVLEMLRNYYPNEYCIKNVFNKTYLKSNNYIFEFPVDECRADIIDAGKTLSCYEIKTKYDSLKRLPKQINDYSKVFEKVYVICSENKYLKVKEIAPDYCGIITYNDRKNFRFNKKRQAKESPNIDIKCILNHFYKKELLYCFKSNDIDMIENAYSKNSIINSYKRALRKRY